MVEPAEFGKMLGGIQPVLSEYMTHNYVRDPARERRQYRGQIRDILNDSEHDRNIMNIREQIAPDVETMDLRTLRKQIVPLIPAFHPMRLKRMAQFLIAAADIRKGQEAIARQLE